MWELLQILFSDVISQKTFICSKSTIETLEKVIKQKRQNDYWNRDGDFIGDFELIYIFLVFFCWIWTGSCLSGFSSCFKVMKVLTIYLQEIK